MAYSGTSRIDIDAPLEEVFALATDVEGFGAWIKDIREVEVLGRTKDGLATAARMRVDVSIREVEYILDYEYDRPNGVSWSSRPGGDIKSLEGSYAFEVNDDGGTDVTYTLELDPGFPVPGFLLKRATKHITSAALSGLKARAEDA
ncbi:MAG: cyclase/dehydrase [Thermoleophilia bacterium]|nr:cyclase/dehydrase [Thermoleophilia bacterium]